MIAYRTFDIGRFNEVVASVVVLNCVFFESECGFGRFLEEAGRDVGKATHNVARAAEKEFRNFNEGTVQPAAKNVERAYNNHVEPELKRTEQNISKIMIGLLAEEEETGTELSRSDICKLEIDILDAEYSV